MRLTILIALSALLLLVAPALAADDPLQPLYDAEYINGHEVYAHLPHGDVLIHSGLIASFPGIERRLSGMMIGDVTVELSGLPRGDGILDLFHEIEGAAAKTVRVTKAYLTASYASGAYIEPTGYATAVRSWDELTAPEQEEIRSVYLQCYSDGFIVEDDGGEGGGGHWAGGGAAGTAPSVELRDPKGKEIFAAIWDDKGQRFDYKVNKAGEITVKDYYRGITMYQSPWAPEEGELDENLDLEWMNYGYVLEPADEGSEQGDFVGITAFADFTVLDDAESFTLVSAPWMDWQETQIAKSSDSEDMDSYIDVDVTRGGPGLSDWMLLVDHPVVAGQSYSVNLTGRFEIPKSYAATGYGGVYRFDTEPIWPGENDPVDIDMQVMLPDGDWKTLASSGSTLFASQPSEIVGVSRILIQAGWENNTRNQMIAATRFPMRELQSDWGTLEVYAPEELIDTVHETEYVAAVGDMMEYYTSLWGDWQGEGANTSRQPIFLLPDESGVQAFENAGFVFILGGSRTGIPLVAHEVAHLWWGQGFSAPRWFQEGMANYSAAKFLEHYRTEQGQDDPLFYRRYILNFALGHELPLSMERRDELDDSAAIYHNSAGFLLTADSRLPYGLDPVLKRFYEAGLNQPNVDHAELRGMFSDAGDNLGPLWDSYVERGEIDVVAADDETYREMVHTPARDSYVKMLNWLTPAYMKSAIGDYSGAIYCAERALEFRSEPKDYYMLADLHFKAGLIDAALERATVLMEREDLDDATKVKTEFLFAKIFREQGDTVNELNALQQVVADGPAANLMYEVQQAQQRIDEINAK